MYKLGTLKQFETEDSAAKKSAGWTRQEIENGKVVKNEDDESVTITNLLNKKQNPDGSDEYLWESVSGYIASKFNIEAIWKKAIVKPIPPKYYIANNNGFYIFGKVDSTSCTSFGSNVTDIEIFDTENEYLNRVQELGIELNEILT